MPRTCIAIRTPDNDIKHEDDEADYTASDTVVPWLSAVALRGEWGCGGKGEQHKLEERCNEVLKHLYLTVDDTRVNVD
jgi:hypothetical protein